MKMWVAPGLLLWSLAVSAGPTGDIVAEMIIYGPGQGADPCVLAETPAADTVLEINLMMSGMDTVGDYIEGGEVLLNGEYQQTIRSKTLGIMPAGKYHYYSVKQYEREYRCGHFEKIIDITNEPLIQDLEAWRGADAD